MQMTSKKRKGIASRPKSLMIPLDWLLKRPGNVTQNIHSRNILPKRNVNLFITKYDEFRRELIRQNWHKALTQFMDEHIDVALVKEFYSNLYDPEDKSPKQVWVRGRLIKFDTTSLNDFLETPPVIQPGEQYPSYSIFCRSRMDPQELASKLCIPRRGFVFNAEGAPWKLLRKDLTRPRPGAFCHILTSPILLIPLIWTWIGRG